MLVTDIVVGRVVEPMPNALYRVELETGHRIVAHVAPAARLRFLRVIPGDRVRVEVSPIDPGRGRITGKDKRLNET
ncbi:MAG TPA: translation initiation factor IF-1 [Candidatus Dormibacteraeota bacterium]